MVDRGEVARNVADVGCGTAVLAMAAARVFPNSVHASDIDEVAVDVARANAEMNGLANRVICLEAAGFDHRVGRPAPFDLVFANILKGPLIELAPSMAAHVASGGTAIFSGLLAVQADSILAAYVTCGFSQLEREDIGEWSTLVLRRA